MPLSHKDFFDRLNKDTLDLVDQFYAPQAEFVDPVVHLKGSQQIRAYYARLYQTVTSIRFEYVSEVHHAQEAFVSWRMYLKAALNNGQELTVDGVSYFRHDAQGQVVFHRDYFDMGEFVYEKAPVLGALVGLAKRMLAGPFRKG